MYENGLEWHHGEWYYPRKIRKLFEDADKGNENKIAEAQAAYFKQRRDWEDALKVKLSESGRNYVAEIRKPFANLTSLYKDFVIDYPHAGVELHEFQSVARSIRSARDWKERAVAAAKLTAWRCTNVKVKESLKPKFDFK